MHKQYKIIKDKNQLHIEITGKFCTSNSRSITLLIWAPTGLFLILLICCSLSVSLENLTAGRGDFAKVLAGTALEGGAVVLVVVLEPAMLLSVDWHFSCCFLNLFKLSCNDPIRGSFASQANYRYIQQAKQI